MNLTVLTQGVAVLKMDPQAEPPSWVYQDKRFLSITYTDEELSIVCSEDVVPENVKGEVETGWSCIKVEGPLDFSLTGILASLANPLADAKVGIYALSTYNTDYLLVKKNQLEKAVQVLRDSGHRFMGNE